MIDTIIVGFTSNFLSPIILFFILGFGARLFKSDLEIPGEISKFIAIYLMMAIGYKGGYSLSQYDLNITILITMAVGIAFSFFIPFLAYGILTKMGLLRPGERAALAAHYGSVSVVTFVTASDFLNVQQISYDSWMVAVLAVMETPALFACFILANKFAQSPGNKVPLTKSVWKEIFLNGSVVLLVGSFVIGFLAKDKGMTAIEPFFIDIFKGVLCLFMIDIGIVAASKLGKDSDAKLSLPLISFGIFMPILAAIMAAITGRLLGFEVGNTMILSVLAASASYIAVPAALRIAMPNINLSLPITMSLAITFPFNIVIGLPLYLAISQYITGL